MASQLTCDMCQAEPATVMESNLLNGETLAFGDNCAASFYLTVLTGMLQSTPAEAIAGYRPVFQPLIDLLAEPAAVTPPREPGKPRKTGSRSTKGARASAGEPTSPDTLTVPSDAADGEQRRCDACQRVAGMPTEPCPFCPDYADVQYPADRPSSYSLPMDNGSRETAGDTDA